MLCNIYIVDFKAYLVSAYITEEIRIINGREEKP